MSEMYQGRVRHVRDMSETCQGHVRDVFEVCQGHVKDMSGTRECHAYYCYYWWWLCWLHGTLQFKAELWLKCCRSCRARSKLWGRMSCFQIRPEALGLWGSLTLHVLLRTFFQLPESAICSNLSAFEWLRLQIVNWDTGRVVKHTWTHTHLGAHRSNMVRDGSHRVSVCDFGWSKHLKVWSWNQWISSNVCDLIWFVKTFIKCVFIWTKQLKLWTIC